MKKGVLSIFSAVVLLVIFSLSASAISFTSVNILADCEGYTIKVEGSIFNSHVQIFDYYLELTASNGDVVEEIKVIGYETEMLIYPPKEQYLKISGSWGEELCGINYTVTGSIDAMKNGIAYDSRDFGPVSFDCPCEPCGDCDGKVTQLTLKYNGLNAADIKVEQKKEGTPFEGEVQPGGIFTFKGTDKGTLGTEISLYIDDVFDTAIHTSCSQPIGPGLVSGQFEVIEGYSLNGGLLCEAYIPLSGTPDGDCDGNVTQLTLQYNGLYNEGVATVVVMQKAPKEPKAPKAKKAPKAPKAPKEPKEPKEPKGKSLVEIFSITLTPGDNTFTFTGTDKGTLGKEISIYVAGSLNTQIHTSCSRPIGPNLVSGDFLVIEGYSRNGGLLDPINGIQPKRTVSAPDGFTLSQNYPNPFNPVTTISFSLPRSSHVTLKIYNALGNEVATLVERNEFAGYHSVMWDASEFSSGIYFYQLTAGSYAETKRLMLLK